MNNTELVDRRRPIARAKIRLRINYDHLALVLKVKREMCVGEEFRSVA